LAAALVVLRPLAHGLPWAGTLGFWLFVLGVVVLPGVMVWRAWGSPGNDWALIAGQGTTLAMALHGFASFAALSLGRAWLGEVALLALGIASFAWWRHQHPRSPASAEVAGESGRVPASLLWLVVVVLVVQRLFSAHGFWEPTPTDLLFHAGNAAEVRQRWPLQDPRVAGLPLAYHVLSYALPAAASRWTGLPVADTLLALAPLLWISLLVLQIYNAGWVFFGDRRVGLLGAALIACHADPGPLLGLPPGAFNSYLATGVYSSPTTVVGFIFFIGIALRIHPLLSATVAPRASSWILLGVLGVAGAATKPSVTATAVGGLVLFALWGGVRRHPAVGRALLAALLLVGATLLPARTSALTARATDLFRWAPGAVVWESEFAQQMTATYGGSGALADLLLRAGVVVVWTVGYFGLAGLAFIAYLRLRSSPWSPGQIWALAALLAGAGPALILHAAGFSQLFFLYNGQLLLALFGAAGLLAALRRWRSSPVLIPLLALLSAPSLGLSLGLVMSNLRWDLGSPRHRPPELVRDYARGLAWLRAHAAQSVVFADNPSFLLSAFGECRTFYESGQFTQRGLRELWRGAAEPFPERVELQQRFLFHPDPTIARQVRDQFPSGTTVRVVADAVQSQVVNGQMVVSIGSVSARRLFPPSLFELELVSPTMHVYRLKAPGDLPPSR
jgi:hypothetical protein